MASKTVVDPEGRIWKVRRRWGHRHVSWRGPNGGRAADLLDEPQGEWKVTGWRASGDLVDSVAERLQAKGQISTASA